MFSNEEYRQNIARVERLTREFMEVMEEELTEAGCTNIQFDTFAVHAVVTFRDPDGDQAEWVNGRFETSKPHVQLGIIANILMTKLLRYNERF